MTDFNEAECLQYNPFDGDFGEPGDKVLSDKIVTARKESPCCECLTPIQKGERVRSMSAVFSGDLHSYRWCSACCHAFSLAFSYDDDEEDEFVAALDARSAVRARNEAAHGIKGDA